MLQKKGQVTLFIVIGILLLAGVSIYFFQHSKAKQVDEQSYIEDVPEELHPLNSYVQGCLVKVAEEGLNVMGQHGGYIYPEKFKITPGDSPITGNAVRFSPGSSLVIPYWSFIDGNDDCLEGHCKMRLAIPPLYRENEIVDGLSIESQLDEYVNENLKRCVGNFEAFRERGYEITEISDAKTTTGVSEDDVSFYVEFPLKVRTGSGTDLEMSKFYARLDVPLKDIYETAAEITKLEVEHSYLEKHALNLISAFSAVDEDKLPPFAESKILAGDETFWQKSKVKDNLKRVFSSYIQLLQVYGARNYEYRYFDSELWRGLYNQGMQIPVNSSVNDIDVKFNYLPTWDIYLDMNCNGEFCGPDSIGLPIFSTLLGVQRYNFAYDISFPVMVELDQPDALSQKGYTFMFFLESNIRRNFPINSSVPEILVDRSDVSLFCDYDQRNSGNITLKVTDSYSDKPVSGAIIGYSCGEDSCSIGKTEDDGTFVGRLPVCFEGFVSVMKKGYVSESKALSTDLGRPGELSISISGLKAINFTVKKKRYAKTGTSWQFIDQAVGLYPEESAVVYLKKIPSSVGEHEYETMSLFNLSAEELELAPGNYSLTINTFYHGGLVIPEHKKKIDSGWLGGDQEVTIPAITFKQDDSFPTGGVMLNFSISEKDMTKEQVTFYTISPDLILAPEQDRYIEDMQFITDIETYSKAQSESIKPTFR